MGQSVTVLDDIRADLRRVVELLERPPQLASRDQLRVGSYLLQVRRIAGPTKWISIITEDGERRIFAEADIETALRTMLTRDG